VSGDTVGRLHAWVGGLADADLPEEVRSTAGRCLLDLVGVAAAGSATELSRLSRGHAVAQFGPGEGTTGARILLDGRRAGAVGAALAGGMTIDSVDAHDGHPLTKGHAGAAILPGLLAVMDAERLQLDGLELLTALVVGYEVALRAGIALHATAPDYHTSGAWNALGVAAVANRLWALDERHLKESLGIAEYHGPRSQMMRCIDHPTMLKDGSGWGAMAGVSAAELARAGFTGAPAVTVESDDVAEIWSDLGRRWRILELYFKPYAVCRWAQPAIAGALAARDGVVPDEVEEVEVRTFHEATRLAVAEPATTEEAQYSLPFPVAVAVVRGRVAAADVDGQTLVDPAVLALSRRVRLVEDEALSRRFPAERLAQVTLRLRNGTVRSSEVVSARGGPDDPLTDAELSAKFHELADGPLGVARAAELEQAIRDLPERGDASELLDLLLS